MLMLPQPPSVFSVLLLLITAVAQDPPRELPGLHNVHRASPSVLLGSEPHGEVAFEELQKLGITTIVSVDGAKPDIRTAAKFGIRYVHIPIGYDGVNTEAAMALTRVAREIPTPIYVHCQHGKHRGPAAAAVLCIAAGTLTPDKAVGLMNRAGTGKNYAGLWRDVKAFKVPSLEAKLPELVEVAEVESMAAAMAKLDRNFNNLKQCEKAGWKSPGDHPDLSPAAEALLVFEGLSECERHLSQDHDDVFREWLKESVADSKDLIKSIEAGDTAKSTQKLNRLEEKCLQCHQSYRNH